MLEVNIHLQTIYTFDLLVSILHCFLIADKEITAFVACHNVLFLKLKCCVQLVIIVKNT